MDVSIIIVNYNTKELTRNCLKSIYEHTYDIDFEVIVSDNGSVDGSIEMIKNEFPQVILIENNANLGFGAANNRGLKIANGKYVFYLNSDTVLLNNAVKIFFDYWENSSEKETIGALGGILLDADMQTIHSGADFPTYKSICFAQINCIVFHIFKTILTILHLRKKYLKIQRSVSKGIFVYPGETDGDITGADLFLQNNAYARFDENFFMYLEETDLELRLKEKKLKRILIEGPKIQHFTRKISDRDFIVKFHEICLQNSSVYYTQKNLNKKACLLKFLIWLDRLNPAVFMMAKKVQQQIDKR